jgi:4-hydroxybenzoate polyprenyltransferase
MKKNILHWLDLLFLIRPILLVPVWGFSLFGYYRAKCFSLTDIINLWNNSSLLTGFLLFFFSLSVGAVYIFNQIADIEVDKKNGGLPLLASGIVRKKDALAFASFLIVVSVVMPLFTEYKVISLLSIFALIIGLLYSFKPFYFSGRPICDFLSNALGYGVIAFGAGWICGGRTFLEAAFLKSALPYFLLMCAGSISSTLPDRAGDYSEQKNTTAVVFGAQKAHIIATFLLINAAIAALIQSDFLAFICAAAPFPFYLGYIFKPTDFFMESTYKIGGAIAMLCSSIIIPLMIPVAIIVFFTTWLYFRLRHGVSYPSLIPVREDV